MKNPLIKRLPRELIGEFPKYIVIFLFMTLTIGFISGFLVAGNSMIIAYDESFEKYNIEDGHVEFEEEADSTDLVIAPRLSELYRLCTSGAKQAEVDKVYRNIIKDNIESSFQS